MRYSIRIWGIKQNKIDINRHKVKHDNMTKQQIFQKVMSNKIDYNNITSLKDHDQHMFEIAYNTYQNGENKAQNRDAKFWLDIDEMNVDINDLPHLSMII